MIKSVLSKFRKTLFICTILLAAIAGLCFRPQMDEQEMLTWTNKVFAENFDPTTDSKLKKCDWVLTPDAFIRMNKTYQNGKQEYFSFHLHRLVDMEYLGNSSFGNLQFTTNQDDIIVQTHNDRKGGDLDTLATVLTVPVRNMQPERLDSLREVLDYFKAKNL